MLVVWHEPSFPIRFLQNVHYIHYYRRGKEIYSEDLMQYIMNREEKILGSYWCGCGRDAQRELSALRRP